MTSSLENKLSKRKEAVFKSKGERHISYFLDLNLIKYQYEPGVLVNPVDQKPRIWYPDFYLPQYKAYIEYYGLAERQSYKKGIELKSKTYSKMKLDVIPVYPWMLSGKWQGYLMKELKRSTYRQYKNLMAKPYWTKQKQFNRHKLSHPNIGYGNRSRTRY